MQQVLESEEVGPTVSENTEVKKTVHRSAEPNHIHSHHRAKHFHVRLQISRRQLRGQIRQVYLLLAWQRR